MNNLLGAITLTLLIVVVLGLFFLFGGDPDVWDKLHNVALGVCK